MIGRIRPWVALLLVVAMGAVACGDDDATSTTIAPVTTAPGTTEGATTTEASSTTGEAVTTTTLAPGPTTLVWGKPYESIYTDPTIGGAAVDWQFLYLVYETLVEMGPNLDPQPGLAASWENPTPTTWLFHLQEGVTFSNGRPMTVDDVVGSLNHLIDPATAAWWPPQLGSIVSITAEDADTVRIELGAPNAKLLAALAGVSASVIPMEELQAGTFVPPTDILGTGPYMVVEHLQDESWTFERNPYYWREGLPVYDRIEILIIPDDAARIAALRDGRIDIANFDNPDAVALLAGVEGVVTTVQATTDLHVARLNNVNPESALFDDRVRTAVNIAIDRAMIAEIALAGTAEPAAPTPPGFADSCDPAALPSAVATLDDARALLADAGAENLEFEMIITTGIPRSAEIAQVIQQNMVEIGVTMSIATVEYGDWLDRVYYQTPADFDATLDWYAAFGDPSMVLTHWDTDLSPYNQPFLRPDAELAATLAEANTVESGSAERAALLSEVCRLADVDAGTVVLVTKPVVVAVRADRVTANIQPVEGYADVFRFIAEFAPAG